MPRSRLLPALAVAAVLAAGVLAFQIVPSSAESARVIAAPAVDEPAGQVPSEVAVLAGGCFWGVQGVFQHVDGVTSAVSGYAGGAKATADYNMVSTGSTGHAESVEIKFDPKKIRYGKILQIFFSVAHDPTQLNRQGPDSGTQYRSAIFTSNETQQKIAEASRDAFEPILAKAGYGHVTTAIVPLGEFYFAEDYHQQYLAKVPNGYCPNHATGVKLPADFVVTPLQYVD